ncbi:hypothetical protein Aperf_G00000007512 [Anoplocephala perfoliata]
MATVGEGVKANDIGPESHFTDYLIKEKFFLTALEFHYELLERGISYSRMSLSTLDSADLRTGSEDQNTLEDQLKARGSELATSPTPTNSEFEAFRDSEPASDTESRALRFLINEYLLHNGCKMSAVQFAEECDVVDQQDLDDWDDVGLTCDRPPDLLCLLRASWSLPRNVSLQRAPFPRVVQNSCISIPSTPSANATIASNLLILDVETQTDSSFESLLKELETGKISLSALKCNFEATKAELEVSRQQIGELRGKVTRIEAENLSLAQESTYWRNQLLCLKREYPDLVGTTVKTPSRNPVPSETATIIKHEEPPTEGYNLEAEKSSEESGREEVSSPAVRPTSPPMDSSESTIALRKIVINQPQFTRRCAAEFVRCASALLPSTEAGDAPLEACRLADTLDEINITIGSHIEDILKYLPDDRKALALPLLVQAICLHPDGAVRDKLLRSLFNLFTDSPEAETSMVEMKRAVTILRQCRDLATCLGPLRIECELLPQIWSQLNEHPSICLRKLLLSACGVMAPATPSRLRSSLLLSILMQSLEDEHTEAVRAVALRSLAAVVVLMEDRDKLPDLVTTFDSILRADWSRLPLPTAPLPCPRPHSGGGGVGYVGACSSALSASCDWLLPTIAQWCLEVDSFNNLLLDPWLERLKCLCFVVTTSNSKLKTDATSLRLKTSFSLNELFRILTVLNRLVPFTFASILQSLAFIRPDGEDSDELTLEVVHEANDGENEEEQSEEGEDAKMSSIGTEQCDRLFTPQYILGKRRYEQLLESFDHILSGEKATQRRSKRPRDQKSALSGEEEEDEKSVEIEEDSESTGSELIASVVGSEDKWPAMDELRCKHLLYIAQMMRSISPQPNSSSTVETTDNTLEYLEQDPVSPQEFVALMQVQFDENHCAPWGLPPTSNILSLCKELCFYVSLFGKMFGAAAVNSYLSEPFRTLLMERSTQGYFEFNLKALTSGVFAGYCCLLASTKSKSEFSKMKTLIANAIFLHSRDSCSLHGVRAAIMALCHSEDAMLVAHEVILPALQSCASCADPAVRRTASKIFYSLVAYLADAVDFDATSAPNTTTVKSIDLTSHPLSKQQTKHHPFTPVTPGGLLEECWQLANQLARDDYTSIGAVGPSDSSSAIGVEAPAIDEHSVDWSCIAVALGPLFCLYSRMLRSSSHVTDSDLKERRNLSENVRIADQVLALMERLMAMVSAESQSALDPSGVHFLIQQQHWETLVCGLLQVANRLFPICPEEFRDTKILPWLYRLTEINNMISDMEQRSRLRQRLISVFSTAAFRLGTEDAMMKWILPGLDRLRLDLVEANEKSSAAELEQLSSDLRQRLSNHTSSLPVPTAAATDTAKNRLRQKFANLLTSAALVALLVEDFPSVGAMRVSGYRYLLDEPEDFEIFEPEDGDEVEIRDNQRAHLLGRLSKRHLRNLAG